MLIRGPELIRVERDGSRVQHADLGHISPLGWSEITADGRGNVYVNTINFDFAEFNEVLTTGRAAHRLRHRRRRRPVQPSGLGRRGPA
jgi:hypothetical protein